MSGANSEGGDERLERADVGAVSDNCAIEALLALALLLQKVPAATALEGILAASGLPDAFLGAGVGLHLWHGGAADCSRKQGGSKGSWQTERGKLKEERDR